MLLKTSRRALSVLACTLLTGCAAEPPTASRQATPDEQRLAEIARANVERKLAKIEAKKLATFDSPDLAERYFLEQRVAPGEEYPLDHLAEQLAVVRQRQALADMLRDPPGDISTWNELGPGNIGGRTRAIAIDHTDPSVMYAGGVAGGVWKSTDAGASWNATDDFMVNLAVTTIVIDPTNTDIIYAGTGEGIAENQAFRRGAGVFKSTDAGATWSQLPGTANPNFYYVNKLQISPNDPARLYAACRTGVWRSTDAGATWQVVLRNPNYIGGVVQSSNGSDHGALDIDVRSDTSPDVVFATFGNSDADGLFRSDDAGDTWLAYSVPSMQGRMSLDIAPSNNDIMYLLMANNGSTGPWGAIVEIYRSDDGGQNWAGRVDFNDPFGPLLMANMVLGTGCLGTFGVYHQGWYDQIMRVDPADPDVVWVGGVDLWRSDDGAQTFGSAGHWFYYTQDDPVPQYIHADHHELVFHPGYNGTTNQTLYAGNDGGLYRTDNARAAVGRDECPLEAPFDQPEINWDRLNNGYGVTQFYHGDSARGLNRFIGGAQDNGSNLVSSRDDYDGWDLVFGGDGGYCAIDPRDDDVIYLEYHQFPAIQKSTDGGENFFEATTGITDTGGVFINPIAIDESNPDVLWTAADRPWRTTSGADFWEAAGPDFAQTSGISAIAVAPSDSNVVYLGYANGYVARTTNALDPSPSWTLLSNGLIGAWVSSVAVDPFDPDTAYVTYSTYGTSHVLRTTNAGANWASIDGTPPNDIPDLPVHWVAVRPCDSSQLYVGTELGVFASDDAGASWLPANTGLANTVVESLDWKRDDILVAFTHGRGAFISYLTTPCNPCAGDVTTQGAAPADPGYGVPDGATTAADLNFFVNAWVAADLVVADVTTQGAADTDPLFGVPDGLVTGSDINYFVNAWIVGCP